MRNFALKIFKAIGENIRSNIAEYYTLLILVVAIPVAVGFLTGFIWGLLLSFVIQATIGVLYIRGIAK